MHSGLLALHLEIQAASCVLLLVAFLLEVFMSTLVPSWGICPWRYGCLRQSGVDGPALKILVALPWRQAYSLSSAFLLLERMRTHISQPFVLTCSSVVTEFPGFLCVVAELSFVQC